MSTETIKGQNTPRSIRDTTRQTVEKSMQIASTAVPDGEWAGMANRESVPGDNVWSLGRILWRLYAEVSSAFAYTKDIGGSDT
jgi:hypothetical protein